MLFISMRAYKCTVQECTYVLCTRFHFCNNASVLYVYVLYVTNIWCQAVYITMCVHKCVHSCTCTLCENSVKMRTQSLSKWYKPSLCVCVWGGGGGGCTGYLHNNARCIVTHVRAL